MPALGSDSHHALTEGLGDCNAYTYSGVRPSGLIGTIDSACCVRYPIAALFACGVQVICVFLVLRVVDAILDSDDPDRRSAALKALVILSCKPVGT